MYFCSAKKKSKEGNSFRTIYFKMYHCWFFRYCSCIYMEKYWSILTYIIDTDTYASALGLWQFGLLQFRDWYLSFLVLNFRYVSSCLPLILFYASFLAIFILFIFLFTYFPYFVLFLSFRLLFYSFYFFLFDFSSIRLLPLLFFLSYCIFFTPIIMTIILPSSNYYQY